MKILKPEKSTAYNPMDSFEPVADWSVEVDYWALVLKIWSFKKYAQAGTNRLIQQDPDASVRAGDPLTRSSFYKFNNTYVNAELTWIPLV